MLSFQLSLLQSQQLLQMEYIPIKKSVIDMVYSMLDYGIIVRRKNLEKTRNGDCKIAVYTNIDSNETNKKFTGKQEKKAY